MNSALDNYDPYLDGFTRAVIRRFARVGKYPPPYLGDPTNPELVLVGLGLQDQRWDPPSLLGTDEEGVTKQIRDFQEDVARGLDLMNDSRDPDLWGAHHRQNAYSDRPLPGMPLIRLWLDDLRPPPHDSWTWVHTVEDAIDTMRTRLVSHASLDHDLGEDEAGVPLPEGSKLVYWMAENEIWPTEAITVHTANVVGAETMLGMIGRYAPFVREGRTTSFVRMRDELPR